jgi:transmembrane sensor
LKNDNSFAEKFQEYRNLWIATGMKTQHTSQNQNNKAWQNISAFILKTEDEDEQSIRVIRLRIVLRYAAMIAVIFCIGWLTSKLTEKKDAVIENPIQEIATLSGSKTKAQLPDGTVVWINAGSSLKYPSRFEGRYREIELNGEAYFEVKHDTAHPFMVKTQQYNVIAVGTVFDAFADKGFFQTTLVDGKVLIQRNGSDEIIALKPNQNVQLNTKNQQLEIKSVDPIYFTSWKDGKLKFDNEPLGQVILKLERWFDCEFVFKEPKMANIQYTGTIEMESVTEIMDLMCITSPKPLRYTFDKDRRIVKIYRK